ncbi:MAG: hypothetical protein ACRDE2_08695, partial [Chitinophagaceae bacterium]
MRKFKLNLLFLISLSVAACNNKHAGKHTKDSMQGMNMNSSQKRDTSMSSMPGMKMNTMNMDSSQPKDTVMNNIAGMNMNSPQK